MDKGVMKFVISFLFEFLAVWKCMPINYYGFKIIRVTCKLISFNLKCILLPPIYAY